MLSRNRQRLRNYSIAFLVVGVAAWIVPSYFSAERYRRRLHAGLERTLHRPVRFGSFSFRLVPRPGFSIQNVEVGEDSEFGSEPFARVDQIDCDLRWHSLWRSRMDFARLHLDHPSFNIVMNARGEWNVEKLLLQSGVTASAGSAPGRNIAVTAEQLDLDVDEARVDFQVGSNKKPFAFTDVRARLQVNPAERRVQFRITASPMRSDLTIPTPGPVEASGVWTPGADLGGPIDARLRTQGALLYDWIPLVTGRNPQVYGVIDSDVHLSGSLPDLIVEGETNLTQLHRWEELPPSDPMPWNIRFRGRLVRGRERIQVESLDASFAESHLHVSGSVDNLQSGPQLDCVVSLEHSRLEDVLAAARRLWPNTSSWNIKGRVDAMLAIQGPWKERRYGGYVGAREISLETSTGSFPISEAAVRINNDGAILTPVQVTLAPHVALLAVGSIERTKLGPQYAVQLAVKGIPLHDAMAFGRGLGVHALQTVTGTGLLTASVRLAGSAWPPARPLLTGRAEMRAARLLIPGLTEPLNLPRASLEITGDQITADPVVAVLGTSVFNARLTHSGARQTPWLIDLSANSLDLEQAALWFDALGLRPPTPLFDRLPGLASFAARRGAASQIFGSLRAGGRFATPLLTYRGITLQDLRGSFAISDRSIRIDDATFRARGGRGEGEGTADFTASPPLLSVRASLAGASLQSFSASFPGPIHGLRGVLTASGDFQTRGLTRDELAENLTGQLEMRVKDISLGAFDPLGMLAAQSAWGKLEPPRAPVTTAAVTLDMEMRGRRVFLKTSPIDLSGAILQLDGTYAWSGAADLNVRADLRRLRRRWLLRQEEIRGLSTHLEVRLGGPLDHLVVNPQEGVARVGRGRGGAVP